MEEQLENMKLSEMAARKKQDAERFLALSCRQAEAVKLKSLDELAAILAQKQQVMLRIDEVDAMIKLLKGKIESAHPGDTGALPRDWTAIQQEIHAILSRAKGIDDESRSSLTQFKDETAAKLKGTRQVKRNLSYYHGDHLHIEGIFLDKKK